MDIFTVYILFSCSHNKTYVGFTNNIERRIWEHNNSTQSSFTSRFQPWEVIYTEEFSIKEAAMAREKWFKSGVGRKLKGEVLDQFLKNK